MSICHVLVVVISSSSSSKTGDA